MVEVRWKCMHKSDRSKAGRQGGKKQAQARATKTEETQVYEQRTREMEMQ